jgi:hypothetical protein
MLARMGERRHRRRGDRHDPCRRHHPWHGGRSRYAAAGRDSQGRRDRNRRRPRGRRRAGRTRGRVAAGPTGGNESATTRRRVSQIRYRQRGGRGGGGGGTGLAATMSAMATRVRDPSRRSTTATPAPYSRRYPITSVIKGPPLGPFSPLTRERITTRRPIWLWSRGTVLLDPAADRSRCPASGPASDVSRPWRDTRLDRQNRPTCPRRIP